MMEKVSAPERRFEMFCAEHRLEVLAYRTRRMKTADAADACSETFLTVWRRIEDFHSARRSRLRPGVLLYLESGGRRCDLGHLGAE